MNTEASIRNWFAEMQASVRALDYDRAQTTLFAPDVIGFGTYKDIAQGVETLRAEQWNNIWPTIRDFTFRVDRLHWGAQGDLAWAACPWDSTAFREDGTPFHRPGRMTVIFHQRQDAWLAVHTHFSLYPTPNAAPSSPAPTP